MIAFETAVSSGAAVFIAWQPLWLQRPTPGARVSQAVTGRSMLAGIAMLALTCVQRD
jgi:hypothetical protein